MTLRNTASLQAGFKGKLSYRSGTGVPGYTGYCPARDCLPLATKGATHRTGATPGPALLPDARRACAGGAGEAGRPRRQCITRAEAACRQAL